ncbi:MAG: hypothetical protein JWO82_3657 [Akkermansiaceae bacterium]|nr:hypothetical protein [Akkermansiaceae bacterium]
MGRPGSMTSPFTGRLLRVALFSVYAGFPAGAGELSPANQMEFELIDQFNRTELAKVNQASEDLRVQYLSELEKLKAALEAANKTRGAALVTEAIDAFRGGPYKEGADPTGTSADPEVAALGKVYLKEHQKLLASVKDRTIAVWKKHRQDLAEFGAKLLKEDKAADAKLVTQEISATDHTIADIQKAAPNGIPESQGGWDGEWDVVYAHGYNRRLKITQVSPTVLSIQALAGWAEHAKYTATYDAAKGYFIAEHVEESGDQREESYLLQSGRILMRHFHDKYPFEKPEAPAVATRSKPQ